MPELLYTASSTAVGGSLTMTALLGILPLAAFFVLLGVFRLRAHISAIGAVLVALLVAWLGYGMPLQLAVISGTEGAVFGLFPILWIVLTAVWFYRLTEASGRTSDLRQFFSILGKGDLRIQALLIAFCFGAILEALAGFGAPVAIVASLLMGLGLKPIKAACVTLVANTAPVAFGAMGTPVTAAGKLMLGAEGVNHAQLIAENAVHQIPWLAVFIPLLLCAMLDGKRGVKQLWPVAIVIGVFFALTQYFSATYFSYELCDITSGIGGFIGALLLLLVWKPKTPEEYALQTESNLTPVRGWMAIFPYVVVILIFAGSKLCPWFSNILKAGSFKIAWPGLHGHIVDAAGKAVGSTVLGFPLLDNPGTLLLFSGIIVAIVYTIFNNNGENKLGIGVSVVAFGKVIFANRFAILTISLVLALAYIMNLSGQTVAIGEWLAGTGKVFVCFSPVLGWLGTAVTGSDTSANALFTALQQAAANKIGVDPHLCVAANSAGGVIGKVVSPQNLSIAAAAIEMEGSESTLLRRVMPISIVLLIALCVIVTIHSGVFF